MSTATRSVPATAPAASFSAGWLALREPFDRAARTAAWPRLRHALAAPPAGGWRVVDLACGTGAGLRGLAAWLGGPQHWLLLDHDAGLLDAALPALVAWAGSAEVVADPAAAGASVSTTWPTWPTWSLAAPAGRVQVVRRRVDLAGALPPIDLHGVHWVTASALLDLVSDDWLARLVDWLAGAPARPALCFALTVDGRLRWWPADPADEPVRAAFAAHQRRDKGFGPALGGQAARRAAARLRAAGYRVQRVRSDWCIDGQAASAMLAAMIDGLAAAAREQQPAQAGLIAAWAARRHAIAPASRLQVGHQDLLAG